MAEDNDDGSLGFEEARIWLPSHVFGENCEDKEYEQLDSPVPCHFGQSWPDKNPVGNPYFPSLWHNPISSSRPAEPAYQYQQPSYSKSSGRRWHHKRRFPTNRTCQSGGGPGMQAIFLESDKKSCGTGFFLPRKAGTVFDSNKKPACSPVLLPSRIVQALNLNVHALGSKHVARQETTEKRRSGFRDQTNCYGSEEQGNGSRSFVFTRSRCTSPEICLPKEWSY